MHTIKTAGKLNYTGHLGRVANKHWHLSIPGLHCTLRRDAHLALYWHLLTLWHTIQK